MSKKGVVRLIVMVLVAISTALTTLYLQDCSGISVKCSDEYCSE